MEFSVEGYKAPQAIYTPTGWDGGDAEAPHDPHKAVDMRMAKACWEVLHSHYPGHMWVVAANHHQGVVLVQLPCFTDWSWCLKINDLKNEPTLKSVMRAGGDFLERYNIPRSGFDLAHFITAMRGITIGSKPPL